MNKQICNSCTDCEHATVGTMLCSKPTLIAGCEGMLPLIFNRDEVQGFRPGRAKFAPGPSLEATWPEESKRGLQASCSRPKM
jgi:hypothetical protein